MNAIEIEAAVSELFAQPFESAEFPFAFLEAFGNKATTIRRLRSGETNKSDTGGVLQTKNIHIAVADAGQTAALLEKLKASPATARARAPFILATDGVQVEAEDLQTGETLACAYEDFPNHFGFFLALAGISTVRQIPTVSGLYKRNGWVSTEIVPDVKKAALQKAIRGKVALHSVIHSDGWRGLSRAG